MIHFFDDAPTIHDKVFKVSMVLVKAFCGGVFGFFACHDLGVNWITILWAIAVVAMGVFVLVTEAIEARAALAHFVTSDVKVHQRVGERLGRYFHCFWAFWTALNVWGFALGVIIWSVVKVARWIA